ncbi:RDD family protein [Mycolicibacterium vinylchloridicum]|uniref:RDD family protein n=1 Tax=Mycolicibacterium vinylchloridicum TaxID=2736928 RepID=UPI0015C9B4CF|nr:RDD family protein [Mycolicibacterium vinylchloridicum]
MSGQPVGADPPCTQCGSALRTNAPYCGACGATVTNRQPRQAVSFDTNTTTAARPFAQVNAPAVVAAGRGVRCCSVLLDVAITISPALPLTAAAAILSSAAVVYIVIPVAAVAVWLWMQIWQGFTGVTFGKAMLGLQLLRRADLSPPTFAACCLRSGILAGTAGLAALPVLTSSIPRDGLHDRLSGVTMIDVTLGANPLGNQQCTSLRATKNRGLNRVGSPLSMTSTGRHGCT